MTKLMQATKHRVSYKPFTNSTCKGSAMDHKQDLDVAHRKNLSPCDCWRYHAHRRSILRYNFIQPGMFLSAQSKTISKQASPCSSGTRVVAGTVSVILHRSPGK